MRPIASSPASPFSAAARSYLFCWSTVNGREGAGRYGDPAFQVPNLGAAVQFPFPLLVAGVDPEAEAKLSGLDRAVVSGRYLTGNDRPTVHARQETLPILVADHANLDLSAEPSVTRLAPAAAEAAFRAGGDRGAFKRVLQGAPAGPVVARATVDAQKAYTTLLETLRTPVGLDATWTSGQPRHRAVGARHVIAQPVRSDPNSWGSAYGFTGTTAGFVIPATAHGTGFRALQENTATYGYNWPTPRSRRSGRLTRAGCRASGIPTAALAATGCGSLPNNPYDKSDVPSSTTTAPATRAAAPAPAAATSGPSARADSAPQAVRAFITTSSTWRFDQLPKIKSGLVAQAAGPLAVQLRKDAEQALTQVSRRVSNQANEGTVQVVNDPKHNGRFFIVTHETAKLGDAHGQSGYFVYTATTTHVCHTYKLTSFKAVS